MKGRKYWYDLGEREVADGLWPEMYFDSHRIILNNLRVFESDKFYGITVFKRKDSKLIIAILNSVIIHLQRELSGFHSLGEGVLKMAVYEVEDMLMPEITKIEANVKSAIVKAFDSLLERPIKPIFEEVKMKDRQKLDSLVLKAIGIDQKKYLKPLYKGLCELVRERIDLAQMRKKVKKAKTQKDVEKLVEQVANEVIPNGIRNFPEEFIDSRYIKKAKEIPVPNKPLKFGSYFMGIQELVSEDGFKYEAPTLEEGKFILFSQKPDSYIIKIPKEKSIVAKAVLDYERHIQKLKDELFQEFFTRTHDHKLSDTLTARVMHESGAKDV